MRDFPIELLHKVFIQLPLFQRLQCMLVCRRWQHVLNTRSLLYDVEITKEEAFRKFNDMIERFPSRTNQVEQLELSYCIHRRYDRRMIPNIFPNLRRVRLVNLPYEKNSNVYRKPLKMNLSKCKIEDIVDYGECYLIRNLIDFDLSAGIKSLEVHLSSEKSNIISHLKNMPALEQLTISACSLTVNECEVFHKNLPSIKNLRFINVVLEYGEVFDGVDDLWPDEDLQIERVNLAEVEPAKSVTSISWYFSASFDDPIHTYIQWCQYMTRKYTHLTRISLYDYEVDEQDSEFITQLFRDAVFPFLQVNGPHLKWLSINVIPPEMNFFEELDRFGCKVEHLKVNPINNVTIFPDLAQSNQTKYIQQITLLNVNINESPLWKAFQSLTTLSLSGDFVLQETGQPKINLDEFVGYLPDTLETLTISDFFFDFNRSVTHQTSVKSLNISCSEITADLVRVISSYFPKLTRLDLYGSVLNSLTLSLPNHHLSYFYISEYGDQEGFHLSIKSDRYPSPRFYLMEYYPLETVISPFYRKKPISVSQEELDNRPIFTIECSSINRVGFRCHNVDLA